jgi:hypothetical protein
VARQVKTVHCEDGMAGPVDITVGFIELLKTNGKTAVIAGALTSSNISDPTFVLKKTAKYAWFYNKVRNGGDWDLKNNVYKPYKKTGVIVAGNTYGNDMPGNYHFGFVGAAAGFSDYILHKGAGEAQQRAGTSKPEYGCTYGDDPTDYEFIRLGIELYDTVGLSVTEAALKSSLAGFQTITCPP